MALNQSIFLLNLFILPRSFFSQPSDRQVESLDLWPELDLRIGSAYHQLSFKVRPLYFLWLQLVLYLFYQTESIWFFLATPVKRSGDRASARGLNLVVSCRVFCHAHPSLGRVFTVPTGWILVEQVNADSWSSYHRLALLALLCKLSAQTRYRIFQSGYPLVQMLFLSSFLHQNRDDLLIAPFHFIIYFL